MGHRGKQRRLEERPELLQPPPLLLQRPPYIAETGKEREKRAKEEDVIGKEEQPLLLLYFALLRPLFLSVEEGPSLPLSPLARR